MKINNKKDINNLLSDLLTPTEILEIYDRIMVVKLLNVGGIRLLKRIS
jgi:uncharacterized protein YerC